MDILVNMVGLRRRDPDGASAGAERLEGDRRISILQRRTQWSPREPCWTPHPAYRCARLRTSLIWTSGSREKISCIPALISSTTVLAKPSLRRKWERRTSSPKPAPARGCDRHSLRVTGLECTVYMGAIDAARQRPNVERMKLLGAKIELVHSGQKTLKDAVNEALRTWVGQPEESHYILGSAWVPTPSLPWWRISKRSSARKPSPDAEGDRRTPRLAVACVGGGSNAIGPFGLCRRFFGQTYWREAGGRSLSLATRGAL